jgi:hypothetical protein
MCCVMPILAAVFFRHGEIAAPGETGSVGIRKCLDPDSVFISSTWRRTVGSCGHDGLSCDSSLYRRLLLVIGLLRLAFQEPTGDFTRDRDLHCAGAEP